MIKHQPDLQAVRDWTNTKLAEDQHPPWAWYQYMKLRETLDAILSAQDSSRMESLPQFQLVDSNYQQDTSQRRPYDETVQMPM